MTLKDVHSDVSSRPVLTAIRSIGDDRYECYAVAFNSSKDKDLYGTYFDANTRYYLDYYSERPWLYDHGIHPMVGRSKIGTWDEIGLDDHGVFVRGELDRAHAYFNRIDALIQAGVLYPSSGAVSRTMRMAEDGHMEDWAIDEVSSTVQPADWRRLNSISPIAQVAMRSMLDGYVEEVSDMTLRDDILKLLSTGARSTVVVKEEEEEGGSDDDSTATTNIGQDQDQEQRVEDTTELVRGIMEGVSVQLSDIRTAITNIDNAVKDQDGILQNHSTVLAGLAAEEVDRTKRALADGGWLEQLHTASRSNDTLKDGAKTKAEAEAAKQVPANPNVSSFQRISGQVPVQ